MNTEKSMSRWEAETLLCRYEQAADAERRRSGTPAWKAISFFREDRHRLGAQSNDDTPGEQSGS
jgi:hypothetical protein